LSHIASLVFSAVHRNRERMANESPSVVEMCAKVKRMGYAASSRVRLYGEDFEELSDPFPEDGGISVHVKSTKDSKTSVLRLPATVLQGVRKRKLLKPSEPLVKK